MSIWEFQACMDGYAAANGAEEKPEIMSDETAAELGVEGF